jgi:hypothetical protein
MWTPFGVRWQAERDTALDQGLQKAIQSAVAAALCRRTPQKNRSTQIKKDGTVNGWLFLPSTVLAASGSRGLCLLPICNCRLPIDSSGRWPQSMPEGNLKSAI